MFHVGRSNGNGASPLQDREARIAAVRTQIGHVEVIDDGTGWSVADVTLKTLEGFCIALCPNLHPAVRSIPDPPVQALASSGRLGEEPEPDTMDAASDEIASSEAHQVEGRL
jgi:hypothetical protein